MKSFYAMIVTMFCAIVFIFSFALSAEEPVPAMESVTDADTETPDVDNALLDEVEQQIIKGFEEGFMNRCQPGDEQLCSCILVKIKQVDGWILKMSMQGVNYEDKVSLVQIKKECEQSLKGE